MNQFKLKTKTSVGVTTVGIYTATSPVTATVVIGITLANIPIPQGSSLEFMQGNKIVLEENDSVTVKSDVNNSLDIALTIMEISP
jgi:hypothetical protein